VITASIMAVGAFAFHAVPHAGGLPELAGGVALRRQPGRARPR
jgi:hypothetical protein